MTRYHTNDPELPPVTVIRRKRQRTMRIRVKDDGVVVSGPASVSRDALLNFVREKSGWIIKTRDRRLQRLREMEAKREAQKGTLLLRGERKQIYGFPVTGLRKPRLVEHKNAVVHQYNPDPQSRQIHPGLQTNPHPQGYQLTLAGMDGDSTSDDRTIMPDSDLIHTFYRNLAKSELPVRVHFWTERLPFQPNKIIIRNQKTKWGSCSSRGTISLNWRLIKCPLEIMDYIIIHELCHLRHFNHSRAFWETVAKYYPDVREARSWIRSRSDEIFGDL